MALNIPLARKVLEHITADREHFDMRTWGTRSVACGTTMCIAGWACHLDPDTTIRWSRGATEGSAEYVEYAETKMTIPRRAVQLLGLSEEHIEHTDHPLFYDTDDGAIELLGKMIEQAEKEQMGQ